MAATSTIRPRSLAFIIAVPRLKSAQLLFLAELRVCGLDVPLVAAEQVAPETVALVLLGNLVFGAGLLRGLSGLDLRLHPRDEIGVEVRVLLRSEEHTSELQ